MLSASLPAFSILLLEGDAEARLLADAEVAIQSIFPDRDVELVRAWATRPDWLLADGPQPASLVRCGAVPDVDVRVLLDRPHRLVIFSLLSAVTLPVQRHREGGAFLAHRGISDRWSADVVAMISAECSEEPPLSPSDAALALEPTIERLQARGSTVAVCTAFRHVNEPLQQRGWDGRLGLREVVRGLNLETARLSQRTGCFVLDFDRPLAHEGGATLNADCFGGDGRAADIALDEFASLLLDAVPDDSGTGEFA